MNGPTAIPNPSIEGSVDVISDELVGGWAKSGASPITVQVFCDGVMIAESDACLARSDLQYEGKGDVAFCFPIAPPADWKILEVKCQGFIHQLPNNKIIRGQETLGRHPLSQIAPGTFWHLIHHFTSAAFPTAPFETSEGIAHPQQDAIAIRLCDYYQRCLSMFVPSEWAATGMWDEISQTSFPLLHQHAVERNIEGLLSRLQTAQMLPETYGMGLGSTMYDACLSGSSSMVNALTIDRLVAAAEATGAMPLENPEQGRYGSSCLLDLAEIVERIEKTLGFRIARKPIMGFFGVPYNGGIIDVRIPDDIYTAHRLTQIAKLTDNIGEIGGGFGGCAEFAIRAGFTNYTIYDLPIVGILQAYFLCLSIGPENVWLEGEDENETAKVRIRPFFSFSANHDVFVNRDSLPELPAATVKAFLSRINDSNSQFLSINQEGEQFAMNSEERQINLNSVIKEYPRIALRSRHPYWIRKGYVEEMYTTAAISTIPESLRNAEAKKNYA